MPYQLSYEDSLGVYKTIEAATSHHFKQAWQTTLKNRKSLVLTHAQGEKMRPLLMTLLLDNHQLTTLNISNLSNFFSASQKRQLKRHVFYNRCKKQIRPLHGVIAACLAINGILAYASLSLIQLFTLNSALFGLALAFFYSKKYYRQYALHRYESYLDNPTFSLTDNQVKALKAGLDAQRWPNYFQSFKRLCTYQTPLAFSAGITVKKPAQIKLIESLDSTRQNNQFRF